MTFPFKAPWLVRGFPTFDRSMRTRSPQKAWPTTRSGLGSRALFFDLFGGCYKVVKVVAKKQFLSLLAGYPMSPFTLEMVRLPCGSLDVSCGVRYAATPLIQAIHVYRL